MVVVNSNLVRNHREEIRERSLPPPIEARSNALVVQEDAKTKT